MKKQTQKQLAELIGAENLDRPLFNCPQWAKDLPYDYGVNTTIRAFKACKEAVGEFGTLADISRCTPRELLEVFKVGVVTVANVFQEYHLLEEKLLKRVKTLEEAIEGASHIDFCISIAYYSAQAMMASSKVAS